MLLLLLAACADGPAANDGALPDAPPSITAVSVECDVGDAEWQLIVETDAWTGNGQLLLSDDGVYLEKHPVYSRASAADGSADELTVALAVVPDWRDVVLGATTYFNCSTPELTGIVRVFTQDGTAAADCRAFGAAPERWASWDLGVSCDTVLAPGE